MTSPITYAEMADLAEVTFREKTEYARTLRDLSVKGKRPAVSVDMAEARLPVYRAIAQEMRHLAKQDRIEEAQQ